MKKNIINNSIKHFLTYTRSERNGTIVLSIILVILICLTFFLRTIITTKVISNNETFERVDSFFNSLEYIEPKEKQDHNNSILKEELPLSREKRQFFFNPNTVSIDSLIDLGLSPKQAQVVINYRSKGGKFKVADDLAKIHVIDSATYKRLKPWVQIPANFNSIDSTKSSASNQAVYVDLNSADSISLTKLKGIGRSFARRIVLYRNLLGGFYSINQLSEVFGLNKEVVSSIEPNIWIDSTAVKRINLNIVTYEELKTHPYLTDYQAKSIIYYRSKRGSFIRVNEILENKLLPEERFNKIKPYFTIK